MADFSPAYVESARSGRLQEIIQEAYDILNDCTLCPRRCRVDRMAGQVGICKTGEQAVVSSWDPHFGEEAPLVGRRVREPYFLPIAICCVFFVKITISVIWGTARRYCLVIWPK